MAISHEQQEAEAKARAETGVDPAAAATAMDTMDADAPRGDPGPATPATAQPPQPERKAPPPARSPFDDKRNAILERFRAHRGEQEQEARDELSDFQRSGMPPEFETLAGTAPGEPQPTTPPQPEPEQGLSESAPAPAPAPQQTAPAEPPRTVKIKVNGQEREVPLEDAINKAQIAYASENILDEAKALRRELLEMRNQPPRAGPPGHQAGLPPQPGHQAGPQGTQSAPEQPPTEPPQADPNQEDLSKLYEAWSFGDPAEAQSLLRDTIDRRVQRAVQQAVAQTVEQQLVAGRMKDEGTRAAKQLSDFQQAHPDIAGDPKARAVIEYNVYELQVQDLRDAGIDPAQLPTQDGIVRPADIAQAHRWFRAQGINLKSPKDMLEQATADYQAWRGPSNGTVTPQPQPQQQAQPTVVISETRQARSEAIPQQPSRTAAPRPAPSAPVAQVRDRSEIVREQMASRNLPRGRVGIS